MRWVQSICMTCSKGSKGHICTTSTPDFPDPCQEREVQQLRERVITQGEELTRLQTLLVQSSDTSETSESESSEFLILRISTISDLSDPIRSHPFRSFWIVDIIAWQIGELDNSDKDPFVANKSHIFALALIWYDSIDFLLALRPWAAVLVSASLRWQFMNSTVIVSAQLRKKHIFSSVSPETAVLRCGWRGSYVSYFTLHWPRRVQQMLARMEDLRLWRPLQPLQPLPLQLLQYSHTSALTVLRCVFWRMTLLWSLKWVKDMQDLIVFAFGGICVCRSASVQDLTPRGTRRSCPQL